ncbi:hypothetical protein MMYC01_207709 [Madurella mycetomatis]|uniref:Uncharacterized protein n=1 Tax=Madurella mycetomatis TaxID=100816 RepID=A0A175VUE0_9PEZI|nr:hypothetical protein MMYC01_207709 [Madurella mycetomatis]
MAVTTVALLGTCDTKLEEFLFLRSQIASRDISVLMIDVGRHRVEHPAITLSRDRLIAEFSPPNSTDPASFPRGDFVKFMTDCATRALSSYFQKGLIHAAISAGGSGNTALAAAAMRDALPIGFPKFLVSTVASGDTAPYVGESDITMLYSVVDVAGLNSVLQDVLSNAGAMIAAAAVAYHSRQRTPLQDVSPKKKTVAITMFGVTTPCVDTIRSHLSTTYPGQFETLVFHATGTGGRAMERLVREGKIDGVIDLTTSEICDLIAGGNMSAGPERLSAAVEKGIPCVLSLGAMDMVNFGPRQTVPERYSHRKLYEHNPAVTLMRVDKNEAKKMGEFILDPPGWIEFDVQGWGLFNDPEVDEVLFNTLSDGLKGSSVWVVEDERDVNDEGFAKKVADALVLMGFSD